MGKALLALMGLGAILFRKRIALDIYLSRALQTGRIEQDYDPKLEELFLPLVGVALIMAAFSEANGDPAALNAIGVCFRRSAS